MTAVGKIVEMIRCMYAGERTTSPMVAELIGEDISIASSVLNHLYKRHGGKFITTIGRLKRRGSAGRYLVVYEVVDPDLPIRLCSGKEHKVPRHSSSPVFTPCLLPYLREIGG